MIVPDVFDVWRLHEIGVHIAIGMLGPRVSPQQLELSRGIAHERPVVFIAPEAAEHPAAAAVVLLSSIAYDHWLKVPRSA